MLSWQFTLYRRVITSRWHDEAVSKRGAFLLYSWPSKGKTTCSRLLSRSGVELRFEAAVCPKAGMQSASKIFSFLPSFIQQTLNDTYPVSSTVLGVGDTTVNKTDEAPLLLELTF